MSLEKRAGELEKKLERVTFLQDCDKSVVDDLRLRVAQLEEAFNHHMISHHSRPDIEAPEPRCSTCKDSGRVPDKYMKDETNPCPDCAKKPYCPRCADQKTVYGVIPCPDCAKCNYCRGTGIDPKSTVEESFPCSKCAKKEYPNIAGSIDKCPYKKPFIQCCGYPNECAPKTSCSCEKKCPPIREDGTCDKCGKQVLPKPADPQPKRTLVDKLQDVVGIETLKDDYHTVPPEKRGVKLMYSSAEKLAKIAEEHYKPLMAHEYCKGTLSNAFMGENIEKGKRMATEELHSKFLDLAKRREGCYWVPIKDVRQLFDGSKDKLFNG